MSAEEAEAALGTEDHTPVAGPRDRLTLRVLQVCDAVGAFIAWWGFKAVHGRIWTLLALHRGPMSQASVARTLGISRALVSSAMHELSEYGLVRPVRDGRHAPWIAVMDVWPVIADVLRSREWMMIETARVALEAAIEEAEIAEELGEAVPWNVTHMRVLLGLTETAQALLKILVALRVPRSIESLGGWLGKASSLIANLRRLR